MLRTTAANVRHEAAFAAIRLSGLVHEQVSGTARALVN